MLVCWKGSFFCSFSYIHSWCYKSFSFSFDLYVVCPWYLLILLLLLVLVSQEHQPVPVSQEHQPVPVSQEHQSVPVSQGGQVVQLVPFRCSAYVVLKKKHADVKTSPPILFRSETAPPPFFCFVLRKTWSPGKEVRWCHSQITQIYQMNYTPVLGPHSRTLNHRQHKIAYFKFLKELKF